MKTITPGLLLILLSMVLHGSVRAALADEPPNIILILADDLGSGDIGVFNTESRIPTPNLDLLSRQGMRFDDAHSPSAVCTPTRYGLLTGRYAWRSRLKQWVLNGNSRLLIDDGRPTLPSVLAESGYATSGVGKWHLGLGSEQPVDYGRPFDSGPLTIGFSQYEGIPASLDMEPYVWIVGDSLEAPPTSELERSEHRRQGGGGFWRKGRSAPGFDMNDVLPRIGRTACRMVTNLAGDDHPFLLYIPLTAPHTPWMPDEEHAGRSEAGHYGDFVAMVDTTVGSILDCLERTGVAKDTIVIFTSDNGAHWPTTDVRTYGHAANLDLRGQKADIHEGGHRVPLIVRWPGRIAADSISSETICLTDVFPTLVAAAGAELPDGAAPDGVNLLPVLRATGEPTDHRRGIIHHSGDGMFAIRSGRWKLVEGLGSGGFTKPARIEVPDGEVGFQLYDLDADPAESVDLASDLPEEVIRLRSLLEEIRSSQRSVRRSE
ncbi:MAG: arylsulfatase [Phycisphaerales bacterium]|jgi:arylsulfatase A-like enzyme|nr:arylsulfatase [Phycisphaerales bacterium]